MNKSICTFYQKIGACRHGEKCSRKHIRPTESRTVLLSNLYANPKTTPSDKNQGIDLRQPEAFDNFFADVYVRLAAEGEIVRVAVCENENPHLNGNVYIQYATKDQAAKAVLLLNQEWFGERPVYCELSPVTNFHEALCRSHDTNSCNRGDHCNFMHVRRPSDAIQSLLRHAQEKLIALAKLRTAMGDEKWGERWEDASSEKYVREEGAARKVAVSREPDHVAKVEPKEEKEETKEEAVAKLFGSL